MKEEYFYPHVWAKVKDYLTPEKAEEANFSIYTMTISLELAEKIYKYIEKENLQTYRQSTKNGRRVKFIYTPNFSVKIYYSGSYTNCFIDSGALGYCGGHNDQFMYNQKKEKSMTKMELYFAILKKYPNHLLGISCTSGDDDSPF